MNIDVSGLENAPALVLIHGWGANANIWQTLEKHLEENWRLYKVNLPGSNGSEPLSNDNVGELLATLMGKLPEKAVWLGWSLGGSLAALAARYYPDRVKALITLATNPLFIQNLGWPNATPVALYDTFTHGLNEDPAKTLKRFMALQVVGEKDKLIQLLKQLKALCEPTPDIMSLKYTLSWLGKIDLRDEYRQLDMPCLHLLGEKDAVVPASVATDIGRLNPQHLVHVMDNACHVGFLNQPENYALAINAFMAQHA